MTKADQVKRLCNKRATNVGFERHFWTTFSQVTIGMRWRGSEIASTWRQSFPAFLRERNAINLRAFVTCGPSDSSEVHAGTIIVGNRSEIAFACRMLGDNLSQHFLWERNTGTFEHLSHADLPTALKFWVNNQTKTAETVTRKAKLEVTQLETAHTVIWHFFTHIPVLLKFL